MTYADTDLLVALMEAAMQEPEIARLLKNAHDPSIRFRDFWDTLPEEQSDIIFDYMHASQELFNQILLFAYNKRKPEQ